MAPVYLNPPQDHSDPFQLAEEQKRDHQHLQLLHSSSHNRPAASGSRPIFLNSSTQDQGMINLEESQQHDQRIDQCIAPGGSSDLQSSISQPKMMNNKLAIRRREVGEGCTSDNSSYSSSSSGESMSSKMRLVNKMINSSSDSRGTTHDESVKVAEKLLHEHDNIEVHSFTTNSSNSSNTVRICSDCNTTTTPLWRSGPRGPKSLCNACGIRQRKARRAMQASVESGTTKANDSSSFTKTKLQINNKDKKPRTSHVAQYKKVQCNTPDTDPPHHEYRSQRKLCFKDFALSLSSNSALKQVFPQDVEEAAILLMELSCGFIHT